MHAIIQTSSDELLELVRLAVRQELNNFGSINETKLERAPATRKEAANYLNISMPTLDKLIRSEQLSSFTIGRQVRIKWTDLESFVNLKD